MKQKFRILKVTGGKSKRVGKAHYKTHRAAQLTINAYLVMNPFNDFMVEAFSE